MFKSLVDKGKIVVKPSFALPEVIVPKLLGAEIGICNYTIKEAIELLKEL